MNVHLGVTEMLEILRYIDYTRLLLLGLSFSSECISVLKLFRKSSACHPDLKHLQWNSEDYQICVGVHVLSKRIVLSSVA